MIVRESTIWLEELLKQETEKYTGANTQGEKEVALGNMERIHKMLIEAYENEAKLEESQVKREEAESREKTETAKIEVQKKTNELTEKLEAVRKREANRLFWTNFGFQAAGIGLNVTKTINEGIFRDNVLGLEQADVIVGKTKSYSLATKTI